MKTKANKSSAAKLTTNGPNRELTHDDIAFAAYCLWENERRPQGHDWDHWFRAESLFEQANRQAKAV